jgi:hypothetical protein
MRKHTAAAADIEKNPKFQERISEVATVRSIAGTRGRQARWAPLPPASADAGMSADGRLNEGEMAYRKERAPIVRAAMATFLADWPPLRAALDGCVRFASDMHRWRLQAWA